MEKHFAFYLTVSQFHTNSVQYAVDCILQLVYKNTAYFTVLYEKYETSTDKTWNFSLPLPTKLHREKEKCFSKI